MERYSYLANKRGKYLGVFDSMVKKLNRLNQEIVAERVAMFEQIQSAEDDIKDAKAALEFLMKEETRNNDVAAKITALL